MSDGLYNAYVSISNSQHTVNHDVACLVQRYMDRTHTVDGIAQLVIDEISDRFHAMVKQDKRSARLDDITLVIRNLGYPMGQLAVTATAPPTVKNPFNFSQSQPHPSTRGSAMPHPPVGMPHYENSQFFRKQFDTLPPSLAHQPYSHTPNVSTGSMYTPPQQHVYAMHSRPSDVYTTNSMYAENVHTMAHHPHPSGPNTQFSVTGQHTKLYSSSSTTSSAATAAASLPQGMRKSGSNPRVGLPPPVPQHGIRHHTHTHITHHTHIHITHITHTHTHHTFAGCAVYVRVHTCTVYTCTSTVSTVYTCTCAAASYTTFSAQAIC